MANLQGARTCKKVHFDVIDIVFYIRNTKIDDEARSNRSDLADIARFKDRVKCVGDQLESVLQRHIGKK